MSDSESTSASTSHLAYSFVSPRIPCKDPSCPRRLRHAAHSSPPLLWSSPGPSVALTLGALSVEMFYCLECGQQATDLTAKQAARHMLYGCHSLAADRMEAIPSSARTHVLFVENGFGGDVVQDVAAFEDREESLGAIIGTVFVGIGFMVVLGWLHSYW